MRLERLGVIGDIHAEAVRLEIALNFLRKAQVDRILCVGDIVDGQGNVDTCCELLTDLDVITVRGNHDRWFTEGSMRGLPEATQWKDVSENSKQVIDALPTTQTLDTVAGQLLLCHGLGANDMQRLMPDDYGYALQVNEELQTLLRDRQYLFVINGHTHRRMVRQFEHLTIINAGTLYYAHDPCLAVVDIRAKQVQFFDFEEFELAHSEPIQIA